MFFFDEDRKDAMFNQTFFICFYNDRNIPNFDKYWENLNIRQFGFFGISK